MNCYAPAFEEMALRISLGAKGKKITLPEAGFEGSIEYVIGDISCVGKEI